MKSILTNNITPLDKTPHQIGAALRELIDTHGLRADGDVNQDPIIAEVGLEDQRPSVFTDPIDPDRADDSPRMTSYRL
jgi:hypothetical protein